MTPLEFIKAKLGDEYKEEYSLLQSSAIEIAGLITEYNEIQEHIKEGHVTLDDKTITPTQWIAYNIRYKQWKAVCKDRMSSMDAAMSKPNKPNYFRANND